MKTNRLKQTIEILSLAGIMMTGTIATLAQNVPDAINYQGRLTDNLGNSLASGYYEIEFRIWDDATANAPADLVWARSFPLHVVEGGLFNILLSNDGGTISTPGEPQFSDLREAFGDEDRYLGLTITVNPSGNIASPVEINPRQKMASAPFAMQAETANQVSNMGVTTAALANQSVTGPKLGLASVGVTNLAAGAVTTSKLNIDGDVHLNDHTLYLRSGTDTGTGLKHAGTFAGTTYDGPVLFGSTNGVLGTTSGGEKAALSWDSTGAIQLFGAPVDLTGGYYPSVGEYKRLEFKTEGIVINYNYAEVVYIQVYPGGGSPLFPGRDTDDKNMFTPPGNNYGMEFNSNASGFAFGKQFMWPVRKGDHIRIYFQSTHGNAINRKLYFIPLGTGGSYDPTNIVSVFSFGTP